MNRFLICIIILSFCSCQQTTTKTSETQITEAEIKTAKALVQGAFDDLWGGVDSTKISKYHTDDFIILEQGEVWDNDRIKQFMRKQLENENRALRINKMKYVSIEKYGPSITMAYENYADFVVNDSIVGKAQWLESALAVETEDGWRLKMMTSSRLKK
ncbi:hypothetical protein N9L92_02405 [Saprospiraceae bacterium]|nr:hypothetical protein [Saprospiraceae bacterium]